MKRYAEIKDNLIKNVAVFEDESELPEGWIDITDITGGKGDIVIDGKLVPKPSRYHVADGTEWVLTPENKILFDDEQKKISNAIEVNKVYSDLEKGVEVAGATYSCNKDDIDSLHENLKLLDLTGDEEIEIIDIDGKSHTLTSGEYRHVCKAIGSTYSEAMKKIKSII